MNSYLPTRYSFKNIFRQSIAMVIIIFLAINGGWFLEGGFEFTCGSILFALIAGLLHGIGVMRYNRYMKAHPEKYDMSKLIPKYSNKTYAEHKAERETKSKDA